MRLIGLLLVRNEEHLIERTLDKMSEYCDIIFIHDDASTDATVDICREHPNVATISMSQYYASDRTWAETHNRAELLRSAQAFGTSKDDWFVYLDADEEIEFDWYMFMKTTIMSPEVVAIRMKLFDFYATEEDAHLDYTHRTKMGPEYRSIIMAFKNTEHLSYHVPIQREVAIGPGSILESGFVKHYGKAISAEHHEMKCEYYARNFPIDYAEKWDNRRGKFIHTISDFGMELITWDEKEEKGVPMP